MNQSRTGLFFFLLVWPILAGMHAVSVSSPGPVSVPGEHALTYGFPGERLPDRPAWEQLLAPVAATQTRVSLEQVSYDGLPVAGPEVLIEEPCSCFPVPAFVPDGTEHAPPFCERLPYDATAPPIAA